MSRELSTVERRLLIAIGGVGLGGMLGFAGFWGGAWLEWMLSTRPPSGGTSMSGLEAVTEWMLLGGVVGLALGALSGVIVTFLLLRKPPAADRYGARVWCEVTSAFFVAGIAAIFVHVGAVLAFGVGVFLAGRAMAGRGTLLGTGVGAAGGLMVGLAAVAGLHALETTPMALLPEPIPQLLFGVFLAVGCIALIAGPVVGFEWSGVRSTRNDEDSA